MSGEENGFIRQCEDFFLDTVHEGLLASAIMIRASVACLENAVANEGDVVGFIIVDTAVLGMPRRVDEP